MLKLVRLELKKNNLFPYLLGVAVIFLFTAAMGLLFAALPLLEPNDESAQMLAEPTFLVSILSILSMSCFSILGSVLYAKMVVEEYTGKKNVLLFTYPQKRSRILLSKCLLISCFLFVSMLLSNTLAISAAMGLGHALGLVTEPLSTALFWEILIFSILISVMANFICFIALRVGFWKKSLIWTLVTTIVLVSPFGNSVMLLSDWFSAVFPIASLVFLLISAVLFAGLMKKVNEMECLP